MCRCCNVGGTISTATVDSHVQPTGTKAAEVCHLIKRHLHNECGKLLCRIFRPFGAVLLLCGSQIIHCNLF
jgi:hypothetical protein